MEFLPIKLSYLKNISEIPCDIFVRIKKQKMEDQYVKLLNGKEVLEPERLEKYLEQNVTEFYVAAENMQLFLTSMADQLVAKLSDDKQRLETRVLSSATAHSVVKSLIREMELTQTSIDISEASIKCMKDTILKSSNLTSVILMLLSHEVSFAYQQCYLRALTCHYILSKQSNPEPHHFDVLSFASFFSDITLDTTEEMLVSNLSEIDANFSEESRQRIMNHPKDAVEMMKGHPEFNQFISTVMLQANGTLSGEGFIKNPAETLHPLSRIFVVADTFVNFLLDPKKPSSKKEILPLLLEKYPNPSYLKIIEALGQKFN